MTRFTDTRFTDTRFTDISAFASIPRLTSLRLSPDGSWLAVGVQTAAGEPRKYVASIWRLDTAAPGRAPVRLTSGAEGEGSPRFLADGSLAFAARRPAAPARCLINKTEPTRQALNAVSVVCV
ncbi:MAG: hypothetical protein ACRDPO_14885 [Streptosporangiaceae bacterium]